MRSIAVVLVSCLSLARAWSQGALTPSTPAITPSPVFVPGSPALTAPSTPGQATTNATLAALSDSLLALQANLQQTLPVLMLFNDNFDCVNLADNTAAPSTANPPGNFSANLGTNFASNFAVNAAVPTGPSLINSAPTRSTTIPVTAASQGFGAVPINRDALRALLVLQNDIQRMLPVLNALNGGTTNFPGSFSNLVGVVPHSP